MILNLFYILLINLFICICKAEPRENAGPAYQTLPESGYNAANVKGVTDCRPSLPEQRSNQVNSAPLNTDGLVSQSLKDETQLKPQNPGYAYVPKKSLPVYKASGETDAKQNRNPTNQLLTPNNDSDEESRTGNNKQLKESESTELGKLVQKCVTNKLRTSKKNRQPKQYDQLGSEELLNTRRSNSNDSDLEEDSLEVQSRNDNPRESLADPAQGAGLRAVTGANPNVLMMNNKKVCYACTSANNPNCWVPNRETTVKYCRRGNDACVTKTYNAGNRLVVIRDCGDSCVNKEGGVHPEYKSCSICHSNLCNDKNGAFNVNINLYSLILGILLITLVKRAV